MGIGNANITREIVRLELAGRILADLLRMNTVLGPEAAFRALNLQVPAIPGRINLTLDRMPHELRLEDIDVDKLPLGRVVMAMYDFAYEQHFPIGIAMYQFQNELELVEDFVIHLDSELFALFLHDSFHTRSAGDAEWKALPALYAMTQARLRLDMGEDLMIDDIALLAGMAEKSVRNATNATGEGQLHVRSGEVTDWIENDEARRWLSLRRGFVPTHFEEMSAVDGEHPESLNSLFELGCYIAERWSALCMTPEMVHEQLEWPDAKFDYLNAISANPQNIDPHDCGDLARSLLVSESWFTSQVMTNLYPHQVGLLLQRKRKCETALPQPQPSVNNDRVCQRVRFTLHDGTELFPIRMKNRQSGKVAYRLSEGGLEGNKSDKAIEVEDEDEMITLVCSEEKSVRLSSADNKRQGLYRKGGRSVRTVELDGQVI
ncbi:MAG: hypothetical protein Q8O79_03285 [Pseudomonadota bacterium]|nr:hypothetical protein [Pseudomonadota bacterium]